MNFNAVRRLLNPQSAEPRPQTESQGVSVRLARPQDRDAVLNFIKNMGFNPRSKRTWDGLHMLAMTAWDRDRLIGAIPLEPRRWQVRPGCIPLVVHQTAVSVDPEYRGQGVGSFMQDAIYNAQPASSVIATVFREDETSQAYRWYLKNGFQTALNIIAWMNHDPDDAPPAPLPYELLEPAHPGVDWAGIDDVWQNLHGDMHGGFVCRSARSRRDWLDAHPYRGIYEYRILQIRRDGELLAYAVLGVGRLHSKTVRVEIMEHAARHGDPELTENLILAVCDYASQHNYGPVRWALSVGDPLASLAGCLGFERDWVFDLLMRPLPGCDFTLPGPQERQECWRYHSLDYS